MRSAGIKRILEFVAWALVWLVVLFLIGHLDFLRQPKGSLYSDSTLYNESIKPRTRLKHVKYDRSTLKKARLIRYKARQSRHHNWTTVVNKTVITDAVEENFNDCLNSNERLQAAIFNLEPSECSDDVDLIWLIKSSIVRNSLRSFVRKSYARDSFQSSGRIYKTIRKIKRVFLVGSEAENDLNPMLVEESKKFNDILQGDFEDTFESVTYKVFMGLQFVKEKCPNVKYILIVEDDAIVLPWNLFPYLPDDPVDHFYGGFFVASTTVRKVKNQWYKYNKSYSCSTYPMYSMGTMIVLSYSTSMAIYDEGVKYKYFALDDVLIGGVAHTLHINSSDFPSDQFSECGTLMQSLRSRTTKNLIVCHDADFRKDQELLWYEFCRTTTLDSYVALSILLYCKEILDF